MQRRRFNRRANVTREDKLNIISAVLTGNFDFASFAPPKQYQVEQEGDLFTVRGFLNNEPEKKMNRDEYEAWHAALKDHDTVFLIVLEDYSQSNLLEDEQLIPDGNKPMQESINKPSATLTPAEKPRARKSPKNTVKSDHVEPEVMLKIDDEYFPMPSSGKISEYGETWEIKNN